MEEEKALALNSLAPSPLNRSNSSPFPSRMGRDSSASLAPGFRFHPTDEELVRYYLKRKVTGKSFRFDPIAVIDIYKSEPWDLPYQSKLKSRDLEWYFFSALDKKYVNGSKTNRATEKGYWKTTGKDRPVRNSTRIVGMKKTLVYHSGRAPRGARTNWVMHEYRLTDEELEKAGIAQLPNKREKGIELRFELLPYVSASRIPLSKENLHEFHLGGCNAFVLCRIFEKSGTGPKNGEQYGAPFVEEEWEDDEVVMVPLPGDEAVTDEVANGDCAFVETNDPDQYLDMGVASESDGLPLNFYNGECSSYPGHSEEFTEDQKPIVGTVETFEPQNDQLLNMPEQYAVDSKPMTDGINGEASHSENPLNFNYAFDASYLDATDNLLVGEGSFLETNDLLNPVEANSVGTVAADVDMPDEYLTYFDADDDITQYITFDSPEYTGSENAVSDQGPPLTQQNVDEEAKEVPMESKNDLQPLPSEEASSSKQHPEESKLVSGKTYPFMKQASHFLGSIPAPPAFASEFPSKEIALRLHSGQSSNSAHVTAGMIRITDFTIGGNEMNWMMGKNGEFNVALSPSFSQTDVNSAAALVPVSGLISGKFAFMVSHGWIFLISFSVVILSLSFKIGCFMYTGKSK